jgi:pimeloyl-ACP methyl ester carboxylesterase
MHKVQFITVDNGVRLEVLDWGGSGRAVVLLAGAGCTAHIFDGFAEKLTDGFHVYGVTRRAVSAPPVIPNLATTSGAESKTSCTSSTR